MSETQSCTYGPACLQAGCRRHTRAATWRASRLRGAWAECEPSCRFATPTPQRRRGHPREPRGVSGRAWGGQHTRRARCLTAHGSLQVVDESQQVDFEAGQVGAERCLEVLEPLPLVVALQRGAVGDAAEVGGVLPRAGLGEEERQRPGFGIEVEDVVGRALFGGDKIDERAGLAPLLPVLAEPPEAFGVDPPDGT